MEIHSFSHKGIERFYRRNSTSGIPAETVSKLRNQLAYLRAMGSVEELFTPILKWKAHYLKGARKGEIALWVTGNYRLTFWVDTGGRICDLNLEDYH